MNKSFLLSLILVISSNSFAEIVEVYRWKPFPGKSAQLLSDMEEAAQIHSDMGISVQINQLGIGSTQNIPHPYVSKASVFWLYPLVCRINSHTC